MSSPASVSDQPKVKLYWLNQSRSQRILWLLEELKVPYELEIIHRLPSKHAPPELKKVHALGKSPVLTILPVGATEPVVLAESAFITEYLLDHFTHGSTLLPTRWKPGQENTLGGETEEWTRFRYYMHYAEGSLMPPLLVALIMSMINSPNLPFFIRPITGMITSKVHESFLEPNFSTHFTFLNEQIQSSPNGGKYLCGEHLTGADILMSFPLVAAKQRAGLTEDKYPELFAYTERLENEAGYKRAVEKIVDIEGEFKAI
ncbi:Bcgst12 [Botrytis cinerea B05.10]|uniref:Bcgst12 n=3 Tax=Botryotinia fuckeliana TaxID=40559 RepID=A0A384JUN4_BOTFB|nr:Bcgst12 [Botrytis cinerea B05.10]ATZ54211.1 Bcgst12 [Botrytis cinerea B05.10]EMR89784.1 putative glutathione s-transferase protein [Botrytis cinerea BcDW1]CCD54190.1 similar to glutathione S-transferase [Botrytis cinerea T4]